MKDIIKDLENPSIQYRPLPFWSWNDKLDPEMIRFQVKEMKKAGMGGYFMHARGGLETKYLSDDWMTAIETGLHEAEKDNMASWVYDEEGWPSGFAGGLVCKLGDSYHGRWLERELRSLVPEDLQFYEENSNSPILGIYSLSVNRESCTPLNRESAGKALKKDMECLVISHNSNPYYIDVLNSDVVAAFINVTHEVYKSRFPDHFDGRFKGFFTDEPRLSGRNIDEDFPWSYILPTQFQSSNNISLLDALPSLFFPCGDYKQIRYHFWELVNKLFVNSFIKQIGDWCRQNNCRLTGHIMMEESISAQMPNTGGVMPFYEHMDIPGIDWLRRTMSNPLVPKQVSSVAAQTGKKQILTESFALCGWNAGFEDLKWVAGWQYVNGVNLLCQHLQGYTIRGLRKRDYPPSLFIQQPWWDQYHLFNDYFARLGLILSSGDNPVDVLVLHPMRSGWILFDGFQKDELKTIDRNFARLLENLSGQHIEYHLGDETIIAKHGSVDGKKLKVGLCHYKTVIIPEALTLASRTLDLLEQFLKQGGKVICINDFPRLENGFISSRSIKTDRGIIFKDPDFFLSTDSGLEPCISLIDHRTSREARDLWATCRTFSNADFRYIVNNSQKDTIHVTARIPGNRDLYLYNPVEHLFQKLESACEDNFRVAELTFEPRRSMILMSGTLPHIPVKENTFDRDEIIGIEGLWNLRMKDPNILTMDRCQYSINGEEWQSEIDVIKLFKLLIEKRDSCHLSMKFTFDSRLEKSDLTDLNLIIEKGEEFSIKVNDKVVICDGRDWWKDSSFKKVSILDKLKKGLNTIQLDREFYQSDKVYQVLFGKNVYETEKNKLTYDVELENIYLTGDFAVHSASPFVKGGNNSLVTEGPFYLTSLPEKVPSSDLTTKGLLFFGGKIHLERNLEITKTGGTRYLLKLNRPEISMIKIIVNDREVTNLLWAPWEADLTDFLVTGNNSLIVVMYGSNRNMLGPHHHIDGEPFSVGPGSFTGKWSWVEKKSEAIPATKEDKKKNYYDSRYAFVPFGLK